MGFSEEPCERSGPNVSRAAFRPEAPPLLERFSIKAPFHQQVATNESETAKVVEPSAQNYCAVEGKEESRATSVFSVSDGKRFDPPELPPE